MMAKVFLTPLEWYGGMSIKVVDTDYIMGIEVMGRDYVEVLYKNGQRIYILFEEVRPIMEAWAPKCVEIWRKVEEFYSIED